MSLLGTDVCIKGDIVVFLETNGIDHRLIKVFDWLRHSVQRTVINDLLFGEVRASQCDKADTSLLAIQVIAMSKQGINWSCPIHTCHHRGGGQAKGKD